MAKLASKRSRLYYGWIVVAAGCIMWTTAFGIQYSFGIFFKPLQEAFGWSRATTSGAMTVHLLVYASCMVPAGWALDRLNTRVLFSIAALLVGLPLVLCSRISEPWQLYLLYGLPLAVGVGACGPAIGAFVTRWFTGGNRGIALGIVSSGVGFGTLVGAPLSNSLIADYGWRNAFLIIGIGACLILLVCAYFIRRSPPTAGQPADKGQSAGQSPSPKMTLRQALRTREMALMLLAQVFALFTQKMILVHIAPHATDVGISESIAALAVGAIGGFSILGRLVMGAVQDKIGARRSMLICTTTQGMTLLALPFIGSDVAFFAFAVAFGFTYGGDVPQVPAIMAQCFGLSLIGVTYALGVSVGNLGGALGPITAGYAFDLTGSYSIVFIGAGLSMFAAALCIWRLRLPH